MDAADASDFENFVRSRSTGLLRTAYLLTGDRGHAEDLLQTVLEKVAKRWHRISSSPDAYVRRSLVNASINRTRRRRVIETPFVDVEKHGVSDGADSRAVRDELMRGLRSLPARQRAVLVLRFFDDLSEQQTAESLGCSVGTVKSQTARGIARLQQLIEPRDIDAQPETASRSQQ